MASDAISLTFSRHREGCTPYEEIPRSCDLRVDDGNQISHLEHWIFSEHKAYLDIPMAHYPMAKEGESVRDSFATVAKV